MNDKLAVPEHGALSASPVFRGAHMVQALTDYRDLQKALDGSMPDQLMTLDGRPFRKKGYWRAVSVAFNLSVEPVTDARSERSVIGTLDDGSENYVYTVSYQARTPSGRTATGDGTCAAAEKQKGRMKATEHNVRSHAHTRAFNRAVSNLVGFGEVSAEEIEHANEQAQPVQKRADGSALVLEVETKTGVGKNGGKSWTMYVVKLDDGREGSTFDQPLAQAAEQARQGAVLVVPIMEQKGKYTNLLSLTPVSMIVPGGPVEEAQQNFEDDVERAALNEEVVRLGNKLQLKGPARAEIWTQYCGDKGPDDVAIVYLHDLVSALKKRAGELT